ncbi:MAG: DUF4416 domain-containing protein [Chloroflexi bacterium]|nr:MAG: DUF4416 domain-containing protein [Chloroflexota bacterium]
MAAEFIKNIYQVKLFAGLIFNDEIFLAKAKKILISFIDKIDFESQILNFTFTDYYEKEMGKNLKRQFVSFESLMPPESIIKIKHTCWEIEKVLSVKGKRRINIDPGYLNLFQLVLATTKPYSHRIYLGERVFVEVTLIFHKGSFSPLPWTYPDYQTEGYLNIFNRLRATYKKQMENLGCLKY